MPSVRFRGLARVCSCHVTRCAVREMSPYPSTSVRVPTQGKEKSGVPNLPAMNRPDTVPTNRRSSAPRVNARRTPSPADRVELRLEPFRQATLAVRKFLHPPCHISILVTIDPDDAIGRAVDRHVPGRGTSWTSKTLGVQAVT